jgi:hypothetical protein
LYRSRGGGKRHDQTQKKEITNMKFKTNAFAQTATRVAPVSGWACLLAVVAAAWMPQTMRAQEGSNPWVLDNFKTGGGKLQATSGTHSVIQNGSGIIGGARSLTLVFGPNADEFGQPSTVQVPAQRRSEGGPSRADLVERLRHSPGFLCGILWPEQ